MVLTFPCEKYERIIWVNHWLENRLNCVLVVGTIEGQPADLRLDIHSDPIAALLTL